MKIESNYATPEFVADVKLKGFKVFKREANPKGYPTLSRRDFYKIVLLSGRVMVNYTDHNLDLDGLYLFFANPMTPYSTTVLSKNQSGYSCYFTEEFYKAYDRSDSLLNSSIFKINGTPSLKLNRKQYDDVSDIFKKMLGETDSDYVLKDDLIRNYINLIIHKALKVQRMDVAPGPKNAAARIASRFLDLLERQFPIASSQNPLQLKSAQDFADALAVHVNHLNRSLKGITGKSTTELISERIATEAKALLQHTDWNVAEIANALGFEYSTYFNSFFKKHTGMIPKSIRQSKVI